jgi:hypothetical protein
LTEAKGILVRLDTRTGDTQAFVLGVSDSAPLQRVKFFDVGDWGDIPSRERSKISLDMM